MPREYAKSRESATADRGTARNQIGHMHETTAVPAVVCTYEQYPEAPQGFGVQVAVPVESVYAS
jgi:hypothetical protein